MAFQRHFFALEPDTAARAALVALPLPAGARPVHEDDLHLTLAFLGTLDAAGEARAGEAAGSAALAWRQAPPGVVLDALEHWRRPGILCAVASGRPDPLQALGSVLAAALRGADLPVDDERPFRSHVTLARKAPRGSPAHLPLPAPVRWSARHLALMASTPAAGSPRYAVLARFHFSTNTAD